MRVDVLLFARLREICCVSRVRVELADGATVADCYASLEDAYPQINGLSESVLVAINEEYAAWTDHPEDGDTVAFIPPVSGG